MSNFDIQAFASKLIGESLFYDDEYGAISNVSLISEDEKKELFIAYFLPEETTFVIDKVTAWEEYDPDEDGAIGYALAIDSDEHMASKSQDDIAKEVLALAEKFNLTPSASLFFEDETD
ncbi:MAG: hypothetical protein AB8G77_23965 [Rhodothermales bacterium]